MFVKPMDSSLKAGVDAYIINLMVPELMASGVNLSDMDAVRIALDKAHFGEALIKSCAERAAEIAHALS